MKVTASDKLLEASGKLFASRPYETVSTREIARNADVNLSAISYHFGSKEGLYKALFVKIVDDLEIVRQAAKNFVELHLKEVAEDKEQAVQLVDGFVSMIVSAVLSQGSQLWRMQLIMREIQSHGPNFDYVVTGHVDFMHDLVGRFAATILGKEETDPEIKLVSLTILSLCLQPGLGREILFHRLDWQEFGEEEKKMLIKMTCKQARAVLGLV